MPDFHRGDLVWSPALDMIGSVLQSVDEFTEVWWEDQFTSWEFEGELELYYLWNDE